MISVVFDRTEMTFLLFWSPITVPERHFRKNGREFPYQNDISKNS